MPSPEVVARRLAAVETVAREVFGYTEGPRPAQRAALESVMAGLDTLVIAPTGQGKSFVFQAPALILPGLVLVVSPLVALMKDQVDKCCAWGIDAGRLNGDMTGPEQHDVLRRLSTMAMLYVAPERIKNRAFMEALRAVKVSLIVLDEAHTLSRWGRDFRPSYSKLAELRPMFPKAPILAVTATADRIVEADIVRLTGLHPGYTRLVQVPDRPNLTYHGTCIDDKHDREAHVAGLLRAAMRQPGSAVVYTATRSAAEKVAAAMEARGISQGAFYHAGMEHHLRRSVQERFMGGQLRWVAATNAFGMGVDKADVRLVYHFQHPATIADYAQEAGRGGRDGLPSDCWLNVSREGTAKREFFERLQNPPWWVYEKLWKHFTGYGRHAVGTKVRTTEARIYGLFPKMPEALHGQVDSAMAYLEFREHIEVMQGPRVYRLPVRSTAKVREYMQHYRGIKLSGAVATVTTDADEADPVMDMVREGAVAYNAPEEAKIVRLRRDSLSVTEAELDAKRGEAEAQHTAVRRLALVEDKVAFMRSHFLPGDAAP